TADRCVDQAKQCQEHERTLGYGQKQAVRRRDDHGNQPSGLNQKEPVDALELDADVGGCNAPVRFDVMSVALTEPSGDLALEAAPVGDAPLTGLELHWSSARPRRYLCR